MHRLAATGKNAKNVPHGGWSALLAPLYRIIEQSTEMGYFFTSESVSEGHPDKVADAISDAILDKLLAYDKDSKVAVETLVTTGQVIVAGEVKSDAYIDIPLVVRETIERIGYNCSELGFDAHSCGVLNAIHEQSQDINRGVERESEEEQGAGDQGMMFGYATTETKNYMPLTLDLAHKIVYELAKIRKEGEVMTYLRPDAKSQVTVEYGDDHRPVHIDRIVVSTQHDEFLSVPAGGTQAETDERMRQQIERDIREIVLPAVMTGETAPLFDERTKLYVNPTGKFVIGGPQGDTGLTGRKIIVDTYGGRGAHGGGAFSGKDPSKVDRSAAYAMRHVAKNMVAAGVADRVLVQVSYAIGRAEPMSIYVNTYGTAHVDMSDGEIARKVGQIFPLTPAAIIKDLDLLKPIYSETAAYGHMGREPQRVVKHFTSKYNNGPRANGPKEVDIEVELFTWEKLDRVEAVRKAFGL